MLLILQVEKKSVNILLRNSIIESMSKVQEYADFSNGKNCFVCDSSSNVRSMAIRLEDEHFVGPVCDQKVCRRDARMNVGNVSSTAKDDGKLLETHFLKRLNDTALSN